MSDKFTINGITYATDSALSFGDYGGAGSVGRANIDLILEDKTLSIDPISYGLTSRIQDLNGRGKDSLRDIHEHVYGADTYFGEEPGPWTAPDGFHAQGSYGSETIWLKLDEDGRNEILDALADYPCIDDEAVSAVEMEWENEAFDNWAESDLMDALPEETRDKLDAMDDRARQDITFEAYRSAMDSENQYPEPEHNGSYIPVDRISNAFAANIAASL